MVPGMHVASAFTPVGDHRALPCLPSAAQGAVSDEELWVAVENFGEATGSGSGCVAVPAAETPRRATSVPAIRQSSGTIRCEACAPTSTNRYAEASGADFVRAVGYVEAPPDALRDLLEALGQFRITAGEHAGRSFSEAWALPQVGYGRWCRDRAVYSMDPGYYLAGMYHCMLQVSHGRPVAVPASLREDNARRQHRSIGKP